ncbi:MAG: PAS domain S-box protein [Planctomycetes bacterium]|nr:PAS domain S-box protein [Planctomycetota bacterium]
MKDIIGGTVESEAERLSLTRKLIDEITKGRNLSEIFSILYSSLSEVVPYDRIGLALLDDRKEKLTMVEVRSNFPLYLGKGYSASIKNSSLYHVIEHAAPRIISDLREYYSKKPESLSTALILKEGMLSSLTLPLISNGNPIGVIFFSSVKRNVYNNSHESFLKQIAGIMSYVIEKNLLLDEVKKAKSYLENILKYSADAILVLDRNHKILTWNQGAVNIFGYTENEVISEGAEILIPEERIKTNELDEIKRLVEKDGSVTNYETERMTKDGSKISVSITSTLIRDKSGKIIGRSSIIRDITKIKMLEEENLHKQRLAAIGEMATVVAHEIKNPLAGINSAMHVLSESLPENSGAKQIVGEVNTLVNRLDRIVKQLLIYSKPYRLNKMQIDLRDLIDRVASLFGEEATGKRINYRTTVDIDQLIFCDPNIVEQILVNLIKNSVEAVDEEGHVEIFAEMRPPFLFISVRDTGMGIREEDMQKIFQPFFTTKSVGTGLGLSICQKLASIHRGYVRLFSKRGIGTTVEVFLGLQ